MIKPPYQNLFEALLRVCDFTALQSEMQEIIDAVDRCMICERIIFITQNT